MLYVSATISRVLLTIPLSFGSLSNQILRHGRQPIRLLSTVRRYSQNIHDVECEMREAEIFDLAGPRLLRLELEDSCLDEHLPFTQTLGQSIARASQPEVEGSMGVYLKQKNGNRFFALTCRHCHFPDNEPAAYSWKNKSQPRLNIMQPGNGTFEQRRKQNERRSYIQRQLSSWKF
jgi:hypothetical protein